MRHALIGLVLGLALAAAIFGGRAALASSSHTSATDPRYWTVSDANDRLSIGRFAARYGVDIADCIGSGKQRVGEYGEKTYRLFDCSVSDKQFNQRQLTLTPTTATTFKVHWLKMQTCTVKA